MKAILILGVALLAGCSTRAVMTSCPADGKPVYTNGLYPFEENGRRGSVQVWACYWCGRTYTVTNWTN